MDGLVTSSTLLAGAATLASVIAVYQLNKFFNGGVCVTVTDLKGKVAVVTGGNSGIGKETAVALARMGASVVLACRDLRRANEAVKTIQRQSGNHSVQAMQLDLADLNSIDNFCTEFSNRFKRLDLLINNAGIMACPQAETKDGFEMQFGVNHLGHFALTNCLIRLLKESAPSRIVNVSSLAQAKGKIHFDDLMLKQNYDAWTAYRQSKLANVLFTRGLHKRYNGCKISSFAVHPGIVRTQLGRHILAAMPWHKKAGYYIFLPLFYIILKSPIAGAQTSIHCAVSPNLPSGEYWADCQVLNPNPVALDDTAVERLWVESENLIANARATREKKNH